MFRRKEDWSPGPSAPADCDAGPKLALLPWGYLIEDFLDTIGISLDEFCSSFTGSWMFGHVQALRDAGVSTVIICISGRVNGPTWRQHGPTGAALCFLPASRPYRLLRQMVRNPYGRTVESVFRDDISRRRLLWPVLRVLQELLGYLSTPPILLGRALARSGCYAVLCQEYEFPRFDVCVVIGKLLGLPVFAIFQGGNYQRSRIERWLRPLAIRLCNGLIIGAAGEIARVRGRYRIPDRKLAQIFNPIDQDVWRALDRQTARNRLGLPPGARIVAWHGRVSMWKKGLDVLVDAWTRLCAEHPVAELLLVLVGDGEDAPWLCDTIDASASRGIHWHRAFLQDRAVIRAYLSAADVYAFPSRHEGFAVAPVEAMACGLPVVSSDISGVRDMFAEGEASGGIIVAVDDPAALAAALWRVLNDPDLERDLGRCAKERARMSFSSAGIGKQLRGFLFQQNAGSAGVAAAGITLKGP